MSIRYFVMFLLIQHSSSANIYEFINVNGCLVKSFREKKDFLLVKSSSVMLRIEIWSYKGM